MCVFVRKNSHSISPCSVYGEGRVGYGEGRGGYGEGRGGYGGVRRGMVVVGGYCEGRGGMVTI